MLDVDLLRTFVAVADTGGFTRASQRLNRTQSTVSQQVRRLEDQVGHRLLDRDRTGGMVVPTVEGEILLGYARRLIGLTAEARDALGRAAGAAVTLGVPEDFAGKRLTALIAGFTHAFPDIRLDITSAWSGELERLLESGDLNLALVKREEQGARCLARWPETLAWVAHRDFDCGATPLPLILFPQGCVYRRCALDAVEQLGRRWRIAFVGQGLASIQAALSSGLGVGLLAGDALLDDHKVLGPADGLPPLPATELALVGPMTRRSEAVSQLAAYVTAHLT